MSLTIQPIELALEVMDYAKPCTLAIPEGATFMSVVELNAVVRMYFAVPDWNRTDVDERTFIMYYSMGDFESVKGKRHEFLGTFIYPIDGKQVIHLFELVGA